MIGGFLLIKVLTCRVLAAGNLPYLTQSLSLLQTAPPSQNPRVSAPRFNLKIVASLFFYLTAEYLENLLHIKGYADDLIQSCGLKNILYPMSDCRLFYKNDNMQTRIALFQELETFLKNLYGLIMKNMK